MPVHDPADDSVFSLLVAWAVYRISTARKSLRPALTAEQAAKAAALSGNPPGI